jgi:uncharacterized membrane protein
VGFTLGQAGRTHAPGRGLLIALALASIALAWSSIHTVYALRYAGSTLTAGRRDRFPRGRSRLGDFAYLALTVGMTFQVSDTDCPIDFLIGGDVRLAQRRSS